MLDSNIYNKMAEVEDGHWWFRGLYDLISCGIRENFGDKDISIVDAGCGTGGNMRYLIKKGYKNIKGFDISRYAVEICKSNGLDVFAGDIIDIGRHFAKESADVIVCNDVFCYLDADEIKRVMDSFYSVLKKGGVIIMNLPSLYIFSGINDEAFSVRHRFNLSDIKDICEDAKYEIKKVIYWPVLLSPIILFIRTCQRIKMKLINDIEIRPDIDLPARYLNALLYRVVQFENYFMRYKPFGSSLFLVTKKIAE